MNEMTRNCHHQTTAHTGTMCNKTENRQHHRSRPAEQQRCCRLRSLTCELISLKTSTPQGRCLFCIQKNCAKTALQKCNLQLTPPVSQKNQQQNRSASGIAALAFCALPGMNQAYLGSLPDPTPLRMSYDWF